MSVADDLRAELRLASKNLSPGERVERALELGRRDLEIYMAASGLDREAARCEIARRRQAGRIPSRCASR